MARRTMRRILFGAALLAILPPAAAAAQVAADTTGGRAASPRGWLIGGAVGIPGGSGNFEPMLSTLGLQVTRFALRRPGLDLSVGFAPRLIGIGGVGGRAGVAVPLAVGRAVLLPVAGVSAIGSAEAGVALFGFHGGASLLPGNLSRTVPRVGITAHRFSDANAIVWLVELGFAGLTGRR